ncbi:NAD(P)-binding protein [Lindgomyces ingoldianus]|uniref:NAD(P)-binding protein n=1 Tax=Lindgomyces ingoldianus TaxID=673940 RepID=A0ACB6QGN3_9PLEO|nr:NAD(P)-binding protein [Lindgomyces ingoldianus]KAF2466184.1 NAD(P)-binding protein [Lindgomyces ingoldianus]
MTTPPLPDTQKSLIFNVQTSALSLTTSSPIPRAEEAGEHLIRVHSTAITNGELTWAPFVNWPIEHVPCYDVSGTIMTEVEGSKFKKGDKVYGRVVADREGTARQYATILPSEAARIPETLGMVDAATVPMSALTAWQAVFEKGGLSAVPYVSDDEGVVGGQAVGKRVLVLGAAGAVGSFAVQFAKIAGAFVVGTASVKNRTFLEERGVEVVDYTKTSMKDWVGGQEERKFDVVFDCVGGKSMLDGWNAVKSGGVYVSVVAGFKEPEGGKPAGVKTEWFIMESRGEELKAIGMFIEKGLVKTSVDSVWTIEDYEKAFARTATGHARGKVVMKIADEE